ncbi:MAG: helix-turn-helix domain-containing protein [Candidatus Omnitrophica bacterium]|nr:helix-turn-helix domain-containing protein [Candidatus Omnitrophota bacterium]MDD5429861.1 helix-turn-helix domain-containing protein [Candidatus Omnitrophota bacterium]
MKPPKVYRFYHQSETEPESASGVNKLIEEFETFFLGSGEGDFYEFLLKAVERPLIENILRRTHGNQLKAAKLLGINRNTLSSKIKKLKIEIGSFKSFHDTRRKK